jgi:hypothetical protein
MRMTVRDVAPELSVPRARISYSLLQVALRGDLTREGIAAAQAAAARVSEDMAALAAALSDAEVPR